MRAFTARGLTSLATAAHPSTVAFSSIASLLDTRHDETPAKDVLKFEDKKRWNHYSLRRPARAVGVGLVRMGFTKGSTLLVAIENNVERATLQLGAAYAGCSVAVVDSCAGGVDLRAALKNTNARGVFVTSDLVEGLRKAVPELDFKAQAKAQQKIIATEDGLPISSAVVPSLKFALHTGAGREPKVFRYRDILGYFPVPDPLDDVLPLGQDEKFFHVVSGKTGEILKSLSSKELSKHAEKVQTALKLTSEDTLMLLSENDPLATIVGLEACLRSSCQLVVPKSSDKASLEALAIFEKATAALGSSSLAPKKVGSRVVSL